MEIDGVSFSSSLEETILFYTPYLVHSVSIRL
jgi:hypothetical protein